MPTVILCGLDEAGKTSIKVYLENIDRGEALKPYIASTEVEGFRRHYLSIYVIPGQERFRQIEFFYEQYFPLADRIALVVDASDRGRFPEVKEYWAYLRAMIDKYGRSREVILVAHKQDKSGAVSADYLMGHIFSKSDRKKYKIRGINTTIMDIFSMYELLRVFYGDLKKVGIDTIVEALCANTRAQAAFLIDGQMLPISVHGSSDALKFMEDIFYPIYKRGVLEYIALKFEKIRFVAISRKTDGDVIVAGVYDYKVPLREAIDFCNRALERYVEEARRRWASIR